MNDISTQNWTPPVFEIDGCDTLPKLFRQNCRKFGSAIAIRERDFGIWEEQQIARHSPVADEVVFSPVWERNVHHFQKQLLETMQA